MSSRQITRNIALTPHFDQFVQDKVESGRYQSASEVVRDGLRLLEEHDRMRTGAVEKLQKDIEVGFQQSEHGEMLDGEAVFDEIRAMSRQRRKATKARK